MNGGPQKSKYPGQFVTARSPNNGVRSFKLDLKKNAKLAQGTDLDDAPSLLMQLWLLLLSAILGRSVFAKHCFNLNEINKLILRNSQHGVTSFPFSKNIKINSQDVDHQKKDNHLLVFLHTLYAEHILYNPTLFWFFLINCAVQVHTKNHVFLIAFILTNTGSKVSFFEDGENTKKPSCFLYILFNDRYFE